MREVLEDIAQERYQQDEKWGEQNHPSIDPYIVKVSAEHGRLPWRISTRYGIPTEDEAKATCDLKMYQNKVTFTDIAVEELCEAVCAENDAARREELVQLAAVVVSWIEAIDRRANETV